MPANVSSLATTSECQSSSRVTVVGKEKTNMFKKPWQDYPQIASSEITPESIWLDRRNLMKAAAAGAGLAATGETLAQSKEPQALSFSVGPDGTASKPPKT